MCIGCARTSFFELQGWRGLGKRFHTIHRDHIERRDHGNERDASVCEKTKRESIPGRRTARCADDVLLLAALGVDLRQSLVKTRKRRGSKIRALGLCKIGPFAKVRAVLSRALKGERDETDAYHRKRCARRFPRGAAEERIVGD